MSSKRGSRNTGDRALVTFVVLTCFAEQKVLQVPHRANGTSTCSSQNDQNYVQSVFALSAVTMIDARRKTESWRNSRRSLTVFKPIRFSAKAEVVAVMVGTGRPKRTSQQVVSATGVSSFNVQVLARKNILQAQRGRKKATSSRWLVPPEIRTSRCWRRGGRDLAAHSGQGHVGASFCPWWKEYSRHGPLYRRVQQIAVRLSRLGSVPSYRKR